MSGLGCGWADEVAIQSGNAAFLRPESATQTDLNADGDTDDQVAQLYLAIIVARLVGLELSERLRGSSREG